MICIFFWVKLKTWYVLYCSKLLSLQSLTLISEILIQSWESNCIREAQWFVREYFEKGLQLSVSLSTLISRNSLEVGHEAWRKVRFQILYLNRIVKFIAAAAKFFCNLWGIFMAMHRKPQIEIWWRNFIFKFLFFFCFMAKFCQWNKRLMKLCLLLVSLHF